MTTIKLSGNMRAIHKTRNKPAGNLAYSSSAQRLRGYRATAERFATGNNAHYFMDRTWRDYRYASPCAACGPAYRLRAKHGKAFATSAEQKAWADLHRYSKIDADLSALERRVCIDFETFPAYGEEMRRASAAALLACSAPIKGASK